MSDEGQTQTVTIRKDKTTHHKIQHIQFVKEYYGFVFHHNAAPEFDQFQDISEIRFSSPFSIFEQLEIERYCTFNNRFT
jgi:hypothetical protein